MTASKLKVGDKVYSDNLSASRTVFGVVTEVSDNQRQDVKVDNWRVDGIKINTTHGQSDWIKYGELKK
tara:strand:- start:419 stop:622 length:204 start_codon:yes stop_codon:yes gene_type:complete